MGTNIILLVLVAYFNSFGHCDIGRSDKAFSLFNVVRFKNSACQATSSADLQGVCYTSEECSDNGGTEDGNCAASFGVCCVLRVNTCPGAATQNGSYVENVGYPTAVTGTAVTCAQTVTRCSPDICQVRLDFTDVVLTVPPATGLCVVTDAMTITPGATNALATQRPPLLCGTLTGQHVYLDAGPPSVTTVATISTQVATGAAQKWRIKVSQIECSSRNRAPNGCLQYFTGIRNTVTSFNFDGTSTRAPGGNLQIQDYTICFRTEEGMCSMAYSQSTLAAGDSFQLMTAGGNGLVAANCLTSYVQIQSGIAATDDRFCGELLSGAAAGTLAGIVESDAKPFSIRHLANGDQTGLAGFSIDAQQVPC